jgi:hypothetical protein
MPKPQRAIISNKRVKECDCVTSMRIRVRLLNRLKPIENVGQLNIILERLLCNPYVVESCM